MNLSALDVGLSALDETLMHQVSLPIGYAATSDHRFYDRFMASAYAPDGSAGLTIGMALYKNMNVMDGFAVVHHKEGTQYNLRISRPLHPDLSMNLGPFHVEILEPFKSIRYVLDKGSEYPHSFDLTMTSPYPAYLEDRHYGRADGRVASDYISYSQNTYLNGIFRVGNDEIEAKDWFMWRDHSWGVRPGIGGFEPFTGSRGGLSPSAILSQGKGQIIFGIGFAAAGHSGWVCMLDTNDGERLFISGYIVLPDGSHQKIIDADYEIDFIGDTGIFSGFDLRFKTEDGKYWDTKSKTVGRSWVFKGTGYDGGYNDCKGHGVYRSTDGGIHLEADSYDIREIGYPKMPDGLPFEQNEHEKYCRIHCQCTLNGEEGDSYIPCIMINYRPKK